MTAPGGAEGRAGHVWQRDARKWNVYFVVVLVLTEASVALSGGFSTAARLTSAVLVLLLLPLYLLTGRRELFRDGTENSPRSAVYFVLAAVLLVPAAMLCPNASNVLFAIGPQLCMLLSRRRAMVAIAGSGLIPLLGGLASGNDSDGFRQTVVFAVLITAFSAVIGGWVQRIVDQSMERAALIAKLDASHEEIARLSAAHGALRERERLAREIHDTLAQGFTSLVMLGEAVESEFDRDPDQARRHIGLIKRTARENLTESRALVAALTPAQLDSGSLEDAVRRLVARLAEELGIKGSVEVGAGNGVDGAVAVDRRRLPPAAEVVALRACQEALANIRKHAHAGRVAVTMTYSPQALELTVADDGRGFDPEVAARSGGYGLAGMRARAAEIGGTAVVCGTPGEGTALTVRLPLAPEAAGADDGTTPMTRLEATA